MLLWYHFDNFKRKPSKTIKKYCNQFFCEAATSNTLRKNNKTSKELWQHSWNLRMNELLLTTARLYWYWLVHRISDRFVLDFMTVIYRSRLDSLKLIIIHILTYFQPMFHFYTPLNKDLTRKNNFFEGCPWFKFNNLGLELGIVLKLCASVAKH